MTTEHVELQITCGNDIEASTIASELVERRLAACVQRFPIRSTYRWDGVVQHDDELLLLVKTTRAEVEEIMEAITELHSDDVPAVTIVPIVGGSRRYLDWVVDETS